MTSDADKSVEQMPNKCPFCDAETLFPTWRMFACGRSAFAPYGPTAITDLSLCNERSAHRDTRKKLKEWVMLAATLAAALGETNKTDPIPGADEALERFNQAVKGGGV